MTDIPLRLHLVREGGRPSRSRPVPGTLVNLSARGLGIETDAMSEREVLRGGQKIIAEFLLPTSTRPITVTGEASWSTLMYALPLKTSTLRFGIEIDEIDERDERMLRAYLEEESGPPRSVTGPELRAPR